MTAKSLRGFNFLGLTRSLRKDKPAPQQPAAQRNEVATRPDAKNTALNTQGRYQNSFEAGKNVTRNYNKSYSNGDTSDLFTPTSKQTRGQELLGKLPSKTLAEGSFEKVVAGISRAGSFDKPGGIAQGQGSFTVAEASVKGHGKVTVGGNGLRATGTVEASATLVNAQGSVRVGKGDYYLDAQGEAYVGAKAKANGELVIDPSKGIYAAKIEADAFVGARIGAEANVNLGKFGSVGARAEAWAGAGVAFKAELGFKQGRLKARVDIGAALGIGFKLGFNIDIDLKGIKDSIKKVIEKPVEIVKDIGNAIGNAFKKLKFW